MAMHVRTEGDKSVSLRQNLRLLLTLFESKPHIIIIFHLETYRQNFEKYHRNGSQTCSSFIFDSIILILAGNEDMHESLDEFKFWPDTTTNSRVICPCASEKLMYNVVNTQGPLFLTGSSSFLQVRRTAIKS